MDRRHDNPWQLAGLLLWRGGLAFSAAYAFYWGAWQVIRRFDWPWQWTSGGAIAVAGFGLVLASIILERVEAGRREGNLLDD